MKKRIVLSLEVEVEVEAFETVQDVARRVCDEVLKIRDVEKLDEFFARVRW